LELPKGSTGYRFFEAKYRAWQRTKTPNFRRISEILEFDARSASPARCQPHRRRISAMDDFADITAGLTLRRLHQISR
jgi:hypothetical protein